MTTTTHAAALTPGDASAWRAARAWAHRRLGMPIAAALALCIPLCFALVHEHMGGFIFPVLLAAYGWGRLVDLGDNNTTTARLVAATTVSITLTWMTMFMSHAPYVETREMAEFHEVWVDFIPTHTAGFPFHAIWGRSDAGAHEILPWPCIAALIANWTFWFAVCWCALLARGLRSRWFDFAAFAACLGTTYLAAIFFASQLD